MKPEIFYGTKIINIKIKDTEELPEEFCKNKCILEVVGNWGGWKIYHVEWGTPPTLEIELTFILNNYTSKKIRNIHLETFIFPSDYRQEIIDVQLSHNDMDIIHDDFGNWILTFDLPVLNAKKKEKLTIKERIRTKHFAVKNKDWGKIESTNKIEKRVLKGKIQTASREEILQLAKKLIGKNIYESVRNVVLFVKRNVKYFENPRRLGAMFALKHGKGACDEITDLCVSILKAMGIKARSIIGFVIGGRAHAWLEVYSPNYGWVPVDPIAGFIGGLSVKWLKLFVEKVPGERFIKINVRRGLKVDLRIRANEEDLKL